MRQIFLALALVSLALPAAAHARLVGSEPKAGSTSKQVEKIVLRFSEPLEPGFSGGQLSDDADHQISAPVAVNGGGITLVTPGLKPGHYRVRWHSVGTDTHRMEGSFQFTVQR